MSGTIHYEVTEFAETLKASFIGGAEVDDRYAPRILANDGGACANVLATLKSELVDCTSFAFSVAFVTASGMQVLAAVLSDLRDRGIPGRVLTSTYQNFNSPDALRKLLEYPNIEARVYQGDLHAKGYFFDKHQLSTVIIGSSNLTQKALTCNKEWNILFRSYADGAMLLDARREYDKLWDDAQTARIDEEWISGYEAFLDAHNVEGAGGKRVSLKAFSLAAAEGDEVGGVPCFEMRKPFAAGEEAGRDGVQLGGFATGTELGAAPGVGGASADDIRPNKMQAGALEALDVLHGREERRALLVSATGSGKTYLSAFDVARVRPAKVLFIAHRQRILKASAKSYARVLGGAYDYAIYAGSSRPVHSTCLFAMVGTLARHLDEFRPDEFDYIVIDEAHRTGAAGYRAIIDYFKPKFLLGMTATPSRTDGYDVYALFNHVIAFRITLQDALDCDMLSPFHYFGVADLAIDEESVDDFTLFNRLTSEARVDHVIRKIEEYSVEKSNRRGLVFCSRKDEARRLAQAFCERGYAAQAVDGDTPEAVRDRTIERLERGELEYIFTVDIMNEGVDIPSLNQIIMLRKTESAIVFVQQLGRGLRKFPGKAYTLVLDFIGNYQQNYLVPIALSGDRTYNKDGLRRVVKEGSSAIPGCSTITFDKVSEQRIFKALEEGRFSDAKLIRNEYAHLRQLLGRIPRLVDFDENEAMDPLIIIKKYGSYAAFLQKYEKDCPHAFGEKKLAYLKFISMKLANGKRAADLLALQRVLRGGSMAADDAPGAIEPGCVGGAEADIAAGPGIAGGTTGVAAAHCSRSVARMLSGEFSTQGQQLVRFEEGRLVLSDGFRGALNDAAFKACVLDAIEFGLMRGRERYANLYDGTDFVLYEKYSREDVAKLLCWEREPNYQNVGGYFYDEATNTFPVFINYEKDPDISITTKYEDRFVSDRRIIAISKSKRSLQSREIVRLANADENGMRCYLFVRKNTHDKDDGTEFYFLGRMRPTGAFEQIVMEGTDTTAVEIEYELDQPVRADLYDYFRSSFDE